MFVIVIRAFRGFTGFRGSRDLVMPRTSFRDHTGMYWVGVLLGLGFALFEGSGFSGS